MKRAWVKKVSRRVHVGRIDLQKLGVALQRDATATVPFFQYRRLVIIIDTKD